MPETKLSGHILVTILEYQDGGLVDLDGTVHLRAGSKVYVGLFASADAAVYLSDETTAE